MISVFALIFVAFVSEVFTASPPGVLVLSFSGFHPDNMTEENTPHLYNDLLPIGAGPPYMRSVFPPTTFVTHFSLATGVHPETHGVYNDNMFNEDENVIPYGKEIFNTNPILVPIWTENQKIFGGRHSGVMMWPGAEFNYSDIAPTRIQSYNTEMSWEDRTTKIVEWMTTSPDKANFVMAYFEDTTCHNKNERAAHLQSHLKKIDDTIFNIYNGIKSSIENGEIDMIILSDHGTQEVAIDKILRIENYVDSQKAYFIVSGPIVFIKSVPGKHDEVFRDVSLHDDSEFKYTVHNIDNFDDHQKMKTDRLENVIILLAKKGYTFIKTEDLQNIVSSVGNEDDVVLDQHGYDIYNTKMNGFFLGIGKKFKDKIFPVEPFNILDVYPLLKLLLDLPSEASNEQRDLALNSVVDQLLENNVSNSYKAQNNP